MTPKGQVRFPGQTDWSGKNSGAGAEHDTWYDDDNI